MPLFDESELKRRRVENWKYSEFEGSRSDRIKGVGGNGCGTDVEVEGEVVYD